MNKRQESWSSEGSLTGAQALCEGGSRKHRAPRGPLGPSCFHSGKEGEEKGVRENLKGLQHVWRESGKNFCSYQTLTGGRKAQPHSDWLNPASLIRHAMRWCLLCASTASPGELHLRIGSSLVAPLLRGQSSAMWIHRFPHPRTQPFPPPRNHSFGVFCVCGHPEVFQK